MFDDKIFLGEDFAIQSKVIFEDQDTSTSLDEFDIHICLSAGTMGRRLNYSTQSPSPDNIERQADNSFSVCFNGRQTALLGEGMITMTTLLIHRQSGVRTIVEDRILNITEPVNTFKHDI